MRHRSRRHGETGFTLIELLVVISVLGVLAAIVIFNLASFINTGRSAACKTDVTTIQTAVDVYWNDHQSYPATGGTVDMSALVPKYVHSTPDPVNVGTLSIDGSGTVTSSKC